MEWEMLEGVPAEEVRMLLSVARRRRFERNEVVFHHGDPADSLHLISKGRFAIRTSTPLGDTFMIGIRSVGESFGEMALVDDHIRSATIVALEPAETFSVYQGDFQRLQAEHPAINQALLTFLTGEVRALHGRLLEALYVPVERRVLRRLLELAELYGAGDTIVVPLTQETIAELAGTSRETANRVLREEAKRGTLELQRGKTVVRDRELLARRAR